MEQVISITNNKGGVGKTTTTASLGKALSLLGKKVLLVDLDSQGNLTSLYLPKTPEETIFGSLVTGNPLPEISISENLSLVPSSPDLIGIERALSAVYPDDRRGQVSVLRRLLESRRKVYDYILLDCPPSLGDLTINALVASDGVYIVLTAESLPVKGLSSLIDAISNTRKVFNKTLELSGILITRYNRRKINRLVEETLRTNFGEIVFRTKIRENVDVMESPLYGKDIFDYSPDSIGAGDYMELAKEVISKPF